MFCGPETEQPFFSSRVKYTHPNTGVEGKGTIEDFAARMTTMGADLINSYQQLAMRGESARFLEKKRGQSLEYGCDASLYPEPTNFDLDLSIKDLCMSLFRAT